MRIPLTDVPRPVVPATAESLRPRADAAAVRALAYGVLGLAMLIVPPACFLLEDLPAGLRLPPVSVLALCVMSLIPLCGAMANAQRSVAACRRAGRRPSGAAEAGMVCGSVGLLLMLVAVLLSGVFCLAAFGLGVAD